MFSYLIINNSTVIIIFNHNFPQLWLAHDVSALHVYIIVDNEFVRVIQCMMDKNVQVYTSGTYVVADDHCTRLRYM